jgi:hypothetical protein
MKYNILSALLFLAGFVVLTGCEEDVKVAVEPRYADVEVSQDIYTGQKAKAQVNLLKLGAYVLHADNSYSLSRGGKIYDSKNWRVVDPQNESPKFEFVVPYEPGTYTLSFSSKYSFYVDLPNGGVYGQSNSVSENVNVKLADAYDACWEDSYERIGEVLSVKDTLVNVHACKVWTGKMNFCEGDVTVADSMGRQSVRVYFFDNEEKLASVKETTVFGLGYKSAYKEFDDGTSGYVNDSLVNKYVYPQLIGIRTQPYYERDGDPVLDGDAKDIYKMSEWSKYQNDRQQADLINAFWRGDLTKYTQKWRLYDDTTGEAVTKCTVSAFCEDGKFVVERLFEKAN